MFNATNAQNITLTLRQSGTVVGGWPITINGQNVDITFLPVYWEDAMDVSLSGKKRSNIRGLNLTASVNFNASLQPTEMETILEGLLNLINPEYELLFTLDGSETISVYPTDAVEVLIEYRDTVRTGGPSAVIPTLEFESSEYFTDISAFV
jgi:hypothetical protein